MQKLNELTQHWTAQLEENIKSIQNMITEQDDDIKDTTAFRQLANWMLNTEHSPYDYMPQNYHSFRSTASETQSTLAQIHHAMVDDGDISFVSLYCKEELIRVFIMFHDKQDDGFKQFCFNDNQELIDLKINNSKISQKFMETISQKFPDKAFEILQILTQKSFSVKAHRNPAKFIAEFENFQKEKLEKTIAQQQSIQDMWQKIKVK